MLFLFFKSSDFKLGWFIFLCFVQTLKEVFDFKNFLYFWMSGKKGEGD